MKKLSKEYKEFFKFIREFKIVSLAIAFIVGLTANELVISFVDNIFMPLIDPLIPGGTWESASLSIGPFSFHWGPFLSSLLHFSIVIIVMYIIVKKLLHYKKDT